MVKVYTDRGFAIYEKITDNRGSEIRVQKSSAADDDYVWIFAKRGGYDDSPHLNVEQAKLIRDALDEFIKDHDDGNSND